MIVRLVLYGCLLTDLVLSSAQASPFCIEQTGMALQCNYADPTVCQRDALRQGGRCAPNPAEFKTPVTSLGYCLVQAGNVASCIYPDRADCDSDAARRKATCVAALPPEPATPAPAPGVDLYQLMRP